MNKSQGRQLKNSYVYGNTAAKMNVTNAVEGASSYQMLKEMRGEEKKAKKMNMGFLYILFLACAITFLAVPLINFVKLQAEITSLSETVSSYETKLNNLTLANDDEYSKMINAINFDEIKQVAIEELGMVYASKDQIITYTKENSDYVIQLNDLSN